MDPADLAAWWKKQQQMRAVYLPAVRLMLDMEPALQGDGAARMRARIEALHSVLKQEPLHGEAPLCDLAKLHTFHRAIVQLIAMLEQSRRPHAEPEPAGVPAVAPCDCVSGGVKKIARGAKHQIALTMDESSEKEYAPSLPHENVPEQFQNQLDLIAEKILGEEERLAIFLKVLTTIRDDDAFLPDECRAIQDEVRECEERVRIMNSVQAEQKHYVETTIKKCTNDIVRREAVLNSLFSTHEMSGHTEIMNFFTDHHDFLKATLINDGNAE